MRIDGSYGEGGGQILRTSIALATVLGEDVEIVNIRVKRKNPGLRNQHLWGIKLVARMCNARVEGLKIGSTRIRFSPGALQGGEYRVDIGTAGSVTLILQTALLPALMADKRVKFDLRGGTDVPWSPPVDYYAHVLFPLLHKMGADVSIEILERGYYPEGGGRVRVIVEPSELQRIELIKRGMLSERNAYLSLRNLPEHIIERMEMQLEDWNVYRDIRRGGISRGCSVILAEKYEYTVMGADNICRRGVPAEKIVRDVMKKIDAERNGGGTVDVNMGDHLIPFGFIAGGIRYRVRESTMHLKTNAWVVEKFGGKVIIENNWIRIYA